MTDTLTRIVADKRAHIAAVKSVRSISDVEQAARAATLPRGFKKALDVTRASGRYALIAEIKKASPSKGLIRVDFDPPSLARAYQAGGATCLSVLTDIPYFQGDDSYLVAAREAVPLPVLRKDFMVDPWQVTEARALGADCILLIAAALSLETMRELEAAAFALGMDVLVEVHNAAEMEQALQLETRLLGINNRDLKSLDVDIHRSIELAALVPDGYTLVGESGLGGPEDLNLLADHGVGAFLVGESLMRQSDVEAATRALLGEA